MMYLVSTLAAGAAAIEVRKLAINTAADKIEFNGHGFVAGDIVLATANFGGVTVPTGGTMFVVDSPTTNDFKLKTFKAADATGDSDQGFSATSGGGATLTKYGSKKCKIANATSSDDKVTCAAATTFALTDELRVYCTDLTGNKCKIDGNVADGATGGGDLGHGDAVWAREANQTSFTLAKVAPTDGAAGTKIDIHTNSHSETANKAWLLSKDTGSVYATAPKTLIADGGKWDTTANEAICGNVQCTIGASTATSYYYTAGSVATGGLTDKNVYWATRADATPWKFTLKATAATGDDLAATGTALAVTSSGNGDTYQKVTAGRRITDSTASDNTITIKGTGANATNWPADTVMIFWCSDTTTAADCEYNVAGMTNGSSFKVKAATGTGPVKVSLKAATGTDATAIAVSANATGKTKGYALKKDTSAAVVFPAAAAGSAARGFAMLGSAVAMATAFLLA